MDIRICQYDKNVFTKRRIWKNLSGKVGTFPSVCSCKWTPPVGSAFFSFLNQTENMEKPPPHVTFARNQKRSCGSSSKNDWFWLKWPHRKCERFWLFWSRANSDWFWLFKGSQTEGFKCSDHLSPPLSKTISSLKCKKYFMQKEQAPLLKETSNGACSSASWWCLFVISQIVYLAV